jgi:hypothetical protein
MQRVHGLQNVYLLNAFLYIISRRLVNYFCFAWQRSSCRWIADDTDCALVKLLHSQCSTVVNLHSCITISQGTAASNLISRNSNAPIAYVCIITPPLLEYFWPFSCQN